jgi:hypothetical protein
MVNSNMMFGIQWYINFGEQYFIILSIFFHFSHHNHCTYRMPKATISIVCCEHNLGIKAEVFELCNSCTLSCATVIPYLMICTELNISALYCFAVYQSVTAVTLQYDYT